MMIPIVKTASFYNKNEKLFDFKLTKKGKKITPIEKQNLCLFHVLHACTKFQQPKSKN